MFSHAKPDGLETLFAVRMGARVDPMVLAPHLADMIESGSNIFIRRENVHRFLGPLFSADALEATALAAAEAEVHPIRRGLMQALAADFALRQGKVAEASRAWAACTAEDPRARALALQVGLEVALAEGDEDSVDGILAPFRARGDLPFQLAAVLQAQATKT